jgi:hypothetical protein
MSALCARFSRGVRNGLSRNWRYNTLNAKELYEIAILNYRMLRTKRQFLAQVAGPQAFVNAS